MHKDTMKNLWESSPLGGVNATYVESLFESYLSSPESIPQQWREFFEAIAAAANVDPQHEISHETVKAQFRDLVKGIPKRGSAMPVDSSMVSWTHEKKQIQVLRLINAYRLQGHLHAQINPLGLRQLDDAYAAELSLEDHGLNNSDMGTAFDVETFVGPKQMPLGHLYRALNETYCGSVGTEYMHIQSPEERAWIQQRIESQHGVPQFSNATRTQILERIIAAEGFEKYLGSRFPGAKRFSLEGGEALIVALDEIIHRGANQKIREMVIGMAHRGRLNVLVNLLGKKPKDLFEEFEGKNQPVLDVESGDVKYHAGYSSDVMTPDGNVHVALAFNPSHLEIVTPVVAGSVRARQRRLKDPDHNKVLSIAIHGDAAFPGQGVVMETLNMSRTPAYKVGGTLHIIINNQIGFTTEGTDLRSTRYCSDVGKVVLAPIFHVNADDPEAVLFVTQLALDYRMRFNKDVIIDLVCYRRHGHNEADEPAATQPTMYRKIRQHPSVRELYSQQLTKAEVVSAQKVKEMMAANRDQLDQGELVARNVVTGLVLEHAVDWTPYFNFDWRLQADTTLSKAEFDKIIPQLLYPPKDFNLHSRVKRIFDDRQRMAKGEINCDWGFAEMLAYAALAHEGHSVRMTGQDCRRGTFFHRHAVLVDQENGKHYSPVENLIHDKSFFDIYDSVLSEEAVLAFEYGYATTDPNALVIWEAQFGDFANGAQVVVDQFISSGQQKWGRLCGLVMLLPHGYEGQGPEHSSARLERYLQLCAEHNMQVCVPSTAAQVFHMLRRQIIRKLRKPLIVMSPKSLLRHKAAASCLSDILDGHFQVIIPETQPLEAKQVQRVVLCSGKVYYDLIGQREKDQRQDVAILRIEQLYPFPEEELRAQLSHYPQAKIVVWCQEEPKNQGVWYQQQHHFHACIAPDQQLHYAGRNASAAPAVGYLKAHLEQQQALVEEALGSPK
jgi:2-oxoglutarate dehydrogenase E1 component